MTTTHFLALGALHPLVYLDGNVRCPIKVQLKKITKLEPHMSLSIVSLVKSDAECEILKASAKKRERRRRKGHN